MTDTDRYIRYDPFEGDRDTNVQCRTVKVVTARKPHECWMGMTPRAERHTIKPGEQARFEHAFVEGEWCSYYVCLPCIDTWLREIGAA